MAETTKHEPPCSARNDDEAAAKLINQYLGMSDIDAEDAAYFRAAMRDTRTEPEAVRDTDVYHETVRRVSAVREKRLAELVEENAQLRAELATKRPETLAGRIAEIYGELDAEDCAMIDREWARMRGYILPSNGTSTLTREKAGRG